jgi:hypothetical protein
LQTSPGTLSKRHQTIDMPDALEARLRNTGAVRDDIELIVATDAGEHGTVWLEVTSRRVAALRAQASS